MPIDPITSSQNPLVRHFVKLRKNKKYREENQSVVIVGKKMIDELAARFPIKNLILEQSSSSNQKNLETREFRRMRCVLNQCQRPGLESFQSRPTFTLVENTSHSTKLPETKWVSKEILQKITGVLSPDGYAAEITLPSYKPLIHKNAILILDKIQDPGNLGTLIRTAYAFGFEGVYLVDGCADPFNDKAIRSSKGASFRIPLCKGDWAHFKREILKETSYHLYAADLFGEDIEKVALASPFALVLGSEGLGLSEEARELSRLITIPISSQMNSLNVAVAGSICMYRMRGKHG